MYIIYMLYIHIYNVYNIYMLYIYKHIYVYIYIHIYIGGKHPINSRTTFSPNPHLEEAQLGFLSLHLHMFRTELHAHTPLEQPKCYILLESVCYLFVTYCHELHDRES